MYVVVGICSNWDIAEIPQSFYCLHSMAESRGNISHSLF